MVPITDAAFRVDKADEAGTIGRLVGYAAVFNSETTIDSYEGRFREVIAPGAFRRTLRNNGDRVKVLFNHGFDPSIGDKPLGKPAVQREDDRGLWVEVPLDDTSYNRDLVASLRSGALDGMSFRFNVNRDEWTEEDKKIPLRTISEVTLHEYGPVTFPAYEATTAGVRARAAYEVWRAAAHSNKADASGPVEPDTPEVETDGPVESDTPEVTTKPQKRLALARSLAGALSKG
jgi:hypothetical protein